MTRRLDLLAAVVALVAVAFLACSEDPLDGAVPQSGGTTSTEDPQGETGGRGERFGASPAPSSATTTTTTTAPERVVPATAGPPVPMATTTTVPPSTAPPTTAASGSCGGWRDLIANYFPGEVAKACAVMMCESEGNPTAASPTNDHGLFQAHAGSAEFPGGWLSEFERVTGAPFYDGVYDPVLNVQFAAWLHGRSGWQPWACA